MNYTFAGTLKESLKKTNSQLPVLIKAFFALFIFMLRDFLICLVLAFAGAYFKGKPGFILELAAILYFLWIAIRLNGALGLALVLISNGEKDAKGLARAALTNSISFFWNALQTGVILFFGQMLLVCPCFLFLNNFIFSPNLYVYENLRGRAAKNRSKELASGFGWVILNRTAMVLFMGYFFLLVVALVLLAKISYAAIFIVMLFGIYFALVQSNFVRSIYQQTLEMHQQGVVATAGKYKLITAFSIILLVLVYIGLHLHL